LLIKLNHTHCVHDWKIRRPCWISVAHVEPESALIVACQGWYVDIVWAQCMYGAVTEKRLGRSPTRQGQLARVVAGGRLMVSCSAVCGGAFNRSGGCGVALIEEDACTSEYCLSAAMVIALGWRYEGSLVLCVWGRLWGYW
jgi:hypothetical protein